MYAVTLHYSTKCTFHIEILNIQSKQHNLDVLFLLTPSYKTSVPRHQHFESIRTNPLILSRNEFPFPLKYYLPSFVENEKHLFLQSCSVTMMYLRSRTGQNIIGPVGISKPCKPMTQFFKIKVYNNYSSQRAHIKRDFKHDYLVNSKLLCLKM